ncbi:hypothetical protein B0H14DRAFT_3596896 [Mycena olivaceomarginata]|nr:hypothetical protein B0H14DRAFT_3596896 [Mycena olivaceomarginata]
MLLRLFTKLATIRMLIIVVDDWKSALSVLEALGHFGAILWRAIASSASRFTGAASETRTYLSLNGVTHRLGKTSPCLSFSHRCSLPRDSCQLPSAVQKLSMDGAGPIFEDQTLDSEFIVPVNLPHLRTLIVADFAVEYVMFLFSQFSAPDVNDLTSHESLRRRLPPSVPPAHLGLHQNQVLTCYSIQFDVSPLGLASMTRWPRLDAALDLPSRWERRQPISLTSSAPPTLKRPSGPTWSSWNCQSIKPSILVQWAKDRANYGTPLRKIYVSED